MNEHYNPTSWSTVYMYVMGFPLSHNWYINIIWVHPNTERLWKIDHSCPAPLAKGFGSYGNVQWVQNAYKFYGVMPSILNEINGDSKRPSISMEFMHCSVVYWNDFPYYLGLLWRFWNEITVGVTLLLTTVILIYPSWKFGSRSLLWVRNSNIWHCSSMP